MQQLSHSVTDPTVGTLFRAIEEGRLILTPEFQRRFVWTQNHQEEFIDTILKGFPFPEIYVCDSIIDSTTLITTQSVIDGQQRLTTIVKYIKGVFDVPLRLVTPFSDLSEEEKQFFIGYKIVVRNIGKVSEETIREVFRRINLTKFSLETVEIQNALYDGQFITTAKEVASSTSLKEFGVFFESEFTRMADLHFILLVMSTIEEGVYFNYDKEVENYITTYNELYEDSEKMKRVLSSTFTAISNLQLDLGSIWFRKSNFFTLVCELAWEIDNLPTDLKEKLLEFEEKIIESRTDGNSEYSAYYKYMLAGTHQRKARITRSSFFRRDVLGEKIEIES